MSFIIEKLIGGYKNDINIKIGEDIVQCHTVILSKYSGMFEIYFQNWNKGEKYW